MSGFVNWLFSPFKKKDPDQPYDVYRPAERGLYSYWDGEKLVQADPIVVYKRMMAVAPELNTSIKVANSLSKDAVKAHGEMIDKIRTVFLIKPFEEGGLTELQTVMLFDHFLTFVGRVKKNSSPSVMSAAGTSADFPPPSSGAESPPTSNSSASGSTGPESSTDVPRSSPSGPPPAPDSSNPASTTTAP